jgi:hypothetical protein
MFNWLRGLGSLGRSHSRTWKANPAAVLQVDYWRYDAAEKRALEGRHLETLSWPELLRLHHLACLELLQSPAGRRQLAGRGSDDSPDEPLRAAQCQETIARLLCPESPYRERSCEVWRAGPEASDEADMQGPLTNASLTHAGCLEVIHLDETHAPTELAFVPFDEIRGVVLGDPALFRAARLVYEGGREEFVLVPLLYGLSWLTDEESDRDGSLTRFCCHVDVPGRGASLGIGVGHQDLMFRSDDDSQMLVGLGSVGEITTSLETSDPNFDAKCWGRGLDPNAIRDRIGDG